MYRHYETGFEELGSISDLFLTEHFSSVNIWSSTAKMADEFGPLGGAIVRRDGAFKDNWVAQKTEKFLRLPLNLEDARDFRKTLWLSASQGEITTRDDRFYFEKLDEVWVALSDRTPNSAGGKRIELKIQSDLNTPPVLVATDQVTGKTRALFDPNPELASDISLVALRRCSGLQKTEVSMKGVSTIALIMKRVPNTPSWFKTTPYKTRSRFTGPPHRTVPAWLSRPALMDPYCPLV